MIMLQPQHVKALIPNFKKRVIFESAFFKAIREEQKSENGMQCKSSNEIILNNQLVPTVSKNKDVIGESPKNNVVGITQKEEIVTSSQNEYVVPQGESVLFNRKDLEAIDDMDFRIIAGKYRRTNSLEPGDRTLLSKCIVKQILKADFKRK